MDLILKDHNLYRNGIIVQLDKEQLLTRETVTYTGSSLDKFYTVKKEDRIDNIAYKFYSPLVKDAGKLWWVVADANAIQNPLDLSELVGVNILIPDLFKFLLLVEA